MNQNNFKTLQDYYNYIEKDITIDSNEKNISLLTELKKYSKDEVINKNVSYEIHFTNFIINKGIHIPKFQVGDTKYPDLNDFDDFCYIIERSKNVKNPIYKSKYNHLIWLSRFKKIDYAKCAITAYIDILSKFNHYDFNSNKSYNYKEIYENLFILSKTINFKNYEIIDIFKVELNKNNINIECKCSIITFIYFNIKKKEYELIEYFFEYLKKSVLLIDIRSREELFKSMIKISKYLKIENSFLFDQLGEHYISLTKIDKEKHSINLVYLTEALKCFRNSKNTELLTETLKEYENTKKNYISSGNAIEIKDKNIHIALSKYIKHKQKIIKHVIKHEKVDTILNFFITNDFLLPNKTIDQNFTPNYLIHFRKIIFDINKNITTKSNGLINTYNLFINNITLNLIKFFFIEVIQSKKITYNGLVFYLNQYSWFGKQSRDKTNFDWIELISPSLKHFMIQLENDIILNKIHPTEYIISIDSLTLKFEGLFREFGRFCGALTIDFKNDNIEERVSFEKLLKENKIKDVLREKDTDFFKYLFTSEGINLRNNVAHSFYTSKHYSFEIQLLLIYALLRLCNYEFKNNN